MWGAREIIRIFLESSANPELKKRIFMSFPVIRIFLKEPGKDASKIPLILTIGNKERESDTLSVRTLEGNVQHGISHEEFLSRVNKHIIQKKLDLDIFSGDWWEQTLQALQATA